MGWVFVAAGLAAGLAIGFWQQILNWANEQIAAWLGRLFGDEVRDAFRMLLAATDRSVVLVKRSIDIVQSRLVSARILFRQMAGGREHEKVVEARLRQDDGQVVTMSQAEIVPWHELPDDVREKFIRRQTSSVELALKLNE